MEENKRFYSQKAIGIATYFGGPLAAGILIRRNFINLNKEKEGLQALILSVIATGLIFWGIFSIPEHLLDKIPNALIPAIYSGIIYVIVERIQGAILKEHKESNGEFYSGWRAFGISLISLSLLIGVVFGYAFMEESSWDTEAYNSKMELHTANENEAMKLFDMLDTAPKSQITRFIRETGIPKWEANLEVLKSADAIENMPEEYKTQVMLLTEYTQLRIEAYELISEAVRTGTSAYDDEIIKRHNRIDVIISEL